jgi:AcrR family transcriptional regulator
VRRDAPAARGGDVERRRLPAPERRAALVECACRVFSQGSYRGTTTAELAREAGVTEPILYRHFDSKRELYLACLEESWARIQVLWETTREAEPDSGAWLTAMGRSFLDSAEHRPVISNLWIQALAEASDDREIARYLRKHMCDVHAYVAGVVQRAQAEGGVPRDRDPAAEAWIFIALGLLSMADRSLGGLMDSAWPVIRESRRRSLTGRG